MSADDYRTADIRLLILQHLQAAADYTAHEHQLREALRTHGHTVSAAALRAQLAWLDEADAIVLMGAQTQVARLTLRGEDYTTGAARMHGIARPRPA